MHGRFLCTYYVLGNSSEGNRGPALLGPIGQGGETDLQSPHTESDNNKGLFHNFTGKEQSRSGETDLD